MSAAILVSPKPIVAPVGDTNASATRGSDAGSDSIFADMMTAKAPPSEASSTNAVGASSSDPVAPSKSLLSATAVAALRPRSGAEMTEPTSETDPSVSVVIDIPIDASPDEDGGSGSTAPTDDVVATDMTAAATDGLGIPGPTPVVAAPLTPTASIDAKSSGPTTTPLTADDSALLLASADGAVSTTDAAGATAANALTATQAFAALLPAMKEAPANASAAQTPASEAPTADEATSATPPATATATATASSDATETLTAAPAPAVRPLTLPIETAVASPAQSPVLSAPPASTAAPAPAPIVVPSTLSQLSQATLETTVQIAAQITRKLEGRSTRFEMGLTPEGLGRVDVSLDIDAGGRLTARLAFDNPLAATELRGKADELRRELTDAGFTIARDGLDFSERQSSSSGGGFDRQQGRAFASASRIAADADLSQPAPAAWMSLSLTRSGVDMKV